MRNTKTEVELDAWRRLKRLLAPSQAGHSDVVASMERLEQDLRVVRQRFGDAVQNLWKSIHMLCIQKDLSENPPDR